MVPREVETLADLCFYVAQVRVAKGWALTTTGRPSL